MQNCKANYFLRNQLYLLLSSLALCWDPCITCSTTVVAQIQTFCQNAVFSSLFAQVLQQTKLNDVMIIVCILASFHYYLPILTFQYPVANKSSHIGEQNLQPSAAVSFKYVLLFTRSQVLTFLNYKKKRHFLLLLFLTIAFHQQEGLFQSNTNSMLFGISQCSISHICLQLTLIPVIITCIPFI